MRLDRRRGIGRTRPFQTLLALALFPASGLHADTGSPTETFPIPESYAPARAAPRDRWFAGGGIGLSFGTVDFIEIVPVIGYRFTPRIHAGLQLLYRYRNDGRYVEDVTTTDYGGTVFGRFFVGEGVFFEVDYEYISFELVNFDLSTYREDEGNVLGGIGYSAPISRHAGFFVVVLYNFTYDDRFSGYEDPWLIRAGVTVGF